MLSLGAVVLYFVLVILWNAGTLSLIDDFLASGTLEEQPGSLERNRKRRLAVG